MFASRAPRSRSRWLPLAVAVLTVGAAACDPKPYVGPTSGPRLSLVGDSLLALAEDEGNARFAGEGWSTSLSGFAGFSVAESYDTLVKAVATEPQVLVIELGTNDVARIGDGELDLAGFADDVVDTIATAASVPCLVWVGVQTTNGVMGARRTEMSALGPAVNAAITSALSSSDRAPGSTFYADWDTLSRGRPELFLGPTDVHHSELGTHEYLDLIDRTIRRCPGNPIDGALELVAGGAGAVTVAGWAADPDVSSSLVEVQIDGLSAAVVRADEERIDLAVMRPWLGARRGFSASIPAAAGLHQACVVALNEGPPASDLEIGCRWVVVTPALPAPTAPVSTTPGVLPEPPVPVAVVPSRWVWVRAS